MVSILPRNSDLVELSMERSLEDRWRVLGEGAEAIGFDKLFSPPPAFLPWLVWEYGLGELTPYVPNLYQLLPEGVQWQRVRGTFEAVSRGLAWIGYSANVEVAWHGRNWWNSYQLRFGSLPANDSPDLVRIEGIMALSVPLRSQLRRGTWLYDIGAVELDVSRLDSCMLDRESGIKATPAGTLWSFGRVTEIEHVLTEAEGLTLGNWIEPPTEESLMWVDAQYPWVSATVPWAETADAQRRALMAAWFLDRILFLVLRDADGDVIGYRRCRSVHPVNQQFSGVYSFGGMAYSPAAGGRSVYIEAMTDFADADAVTAASVSLLVSPQLSTGVPPGRAWCQPDELSGGVEIAIATVSIPLRLTVRDQIKFMMRF